MAYLAFYNKYRPQSFEEVVGQKPIVETLKNALADGKIAHAYLFCGPRGTGKTTMARLLAKALNCQKGIGHQCNDCENCTAITRGDHPDVIEIDAASNSNVESVRELIDNVAYQPIQSPYKIYIIDEVHNMSNSAFNALLKTLEEPPSFVVFILATTEPQKIIPTILSRVQRFDFSKVSEEDLVMNMANILTKEKVAFEKEALELVASLSDGGVRDSLSLLDQLVSYSGEKVTVEDVNNLFGLLSVKDELHILELISENKADEVIRLVRDKYAKGIDINRLHGDLISLYKDIILYKTTKDKTLIERLTAKQCEDFNEELPVLERNIRLLIEAKREYRYVDNALNHFELTLLEILLKPAETVMVTKTVVQKAVTKEEKPPVKEEETLASKAVVINGNNNNGFEAKPKEDTSINKEEAIRYTQEDILNLMYRALIQKTTDERVAVKNKWPELQNLFTTDRSYEAKALSSCAARLLADDILLVTTKLPMEKAKINKKVSQPIYNGICKDVFGKPYRVLAVLEKEFMDAYAIFRTGESRIDQEPTIDFGVVKKAETSTDFFNDLFRDDE